MSNYWNQLSKESQKEIIDWYKKSKAETPSNEFDKGKIYAAELLFGEENLKIDPEIKTWEGIDKSKLGPEYETIKELEDWNDKKLANKLIATYKISKMIQFRYRKVTFDEFMKDTLEYYSIRFNNKELEVYSTFEYNDLLLFRTDEEAREFKNNNVALLKDYFQIN